MLKKTQTGICFRMFVLYVFVFQNLQVENEDNDFPSAFDELGQLGEEMDYISEENVVVSGKRREKKNTANKHLLQKRIQYATRGKKHSYCEPEVPDDDHYICEWNNYNFLNTLSLRVFYGVYTGVNRGPKEICSPVKCIRASL